MLVAGTAEGGDVGHEGGVGAVRRHSAGDLSAQDIQGLGAGALQGFRIRGEVFPDGSGLSVAGAGDVNGDGVDDLIIGAYLNDTGGADSGATYIVFGGQGGLTGRCGLDGLGAADACDRRPTRPDRAGRGLDGLGSVLLLVLREPGGSRHG